MPNLKLHGVPPFPLKTTDTYLLRESPHTMPDNSFACGVEGGHRSLLFARGNGGTGEHELVFSPHNRNPDKTLVPVNSFPRVASTVSGTLGPRHRGCSVVVSTHAFRSRHLASHKELRY